MSRSPLSRPRRASTTRYFRGRTSSICRGALIAVSELPSPVRQAATALCCAEHRFPHDGFCNRKSLAASRWNQPPSSHQHVSVSRLSCHGLATVAAESCLFTSCRSPSASAALNLRVKSPSPYGRVTGHTVSCLASNLPPPLSRHRHSEPSPLCAGLHHLGCCCLCGRRAAIAKLSSASDGRARCTSPQRQATRSAHFGSGLL